MNDRDDCGVILSYEEARREQQLLMENRRESIKSWLHAAAIVLAAIAVVVVWFLIPWPKIP